jgi:hypothetical protein
MIPGRDADWGPRPSQSPSTPAKAPSRQTASVPRPAAESKRSTRWLVWGICAVAGALIAAVAAPILLRKSGTPQRFESKTAPPKRTFSEADHRSRGRYESEGVSVKFNLPEKPPPSTEDVPQDPLAPGY